ncbi:MAG: hypothetical protein KC503_35745 [Myxococcales bacterium]|nr:hypothetical protein [Myxococcales bacterium]
MLKITGTVRKTDLEGGSYTFVTDQGVTYQLDGGGSDLLKDGVRAEIAGAIAEGKMGIAMMGDIFEVKSYKII